jgi:H+-transporting ATPase
MRFMQKFHPKSDATDANEKQNREEDEDAMGNPSMEEILSRFQVDPDKGLTQNEVTERLGKYGYNEVPERRKNPMRGFLSKFWGLSAWMLESIIILSAWLGRYPELIIVSILLVMNAVLSFLQDQRSAGVIETLRKRLRVDARVLREASWSLIPARELVPGDIIRLRPGDIVPADAKLLAGLLMLDQAALTGESSDVEKNIGDTLPSGSVVRVGEGNGVVMLTGKDTYFGKTTELVQEARPKLHIEEVVAKVVRWLFVIVGALLGVVIVMSFFRSVPITDILPLVLVLLMSAVPVALPVMFTVSMAVGAKELAQRGVLVTRLSAIEDAASMDVLCVDKTGTITMNQLSIVSITTFGEMTEEDVLYAGALASQEANQDPIDLSFLGKAKADHLLDNLQSVKIISFTPFNTKNRRTEALIEQSGKRHRIMKGAVRVIAQVCGLKPEEIDALEEQVRGSAQKGYRTLAVARGLETEVPILIGLVTLFDPVRSDAPKLIVDLKNLGISVKILTGDALAVAVEIAQKLGLSNIRRLADLKGSGERPSTEDIDFPMDVDGFAEIYPEDKFSIVKQLQRTGHITGMTGDGVNDAPALRQAEVGIAVSSATDVAKSAASVVLTEPGLTNIVSLVEQGRTIYQRILTWIINKISRTILKSAYVVIAYAVTGKFVVSAFAMLLLVFMTDFAKISLATDYVSPSQKPETWKIGGYVFMAVAIGLAMVVESLALLYIGWTRFGLSSNDNALFTFSFLSLLYFAAFSILSVRERRWFWKTMPSKTLIAALFADISIGTALTFIGIPGIDPLPWWQVITILGYAMASCLFLNDLLKVTIIKRLSRG